jgi:hypothetical protein
VPCEPATPRPAAPLVSQTSVKKLVCAPNAMLAKTRPVGSIHGESQRHETHRPVTEVLPTRAAADADATVAVRVRGDHVEQLDAARLLGRVVVVLRDAARHRGPDRGGILGVPAGGGGAERVIRLLPPGVFFCPCLSTIEHGVGAGGAWGSPRTPQLGVHLLLGAHGQRPAAEHAPR